MLPIPAFWLLGLVVVGGFIWERLGEFMVSATDGADEVITTVVTIVGLPFHEKGVFRSGFQLGMASGADVSVYQRGLLNYFHNLLLGNVHPTDGMYPGERL